VPGKLLIGVVAQVSGDHGSLPGKEQELAIGRERVDLVGSEQRAADMLLPEADPAARCVERSAHRLEHDGFPARTDRGRGALSPGR